MTVPQTVKKPNVLEIMAQKFNLGQQTFLTTLKATVMKADKTGRIPTNEEVAAFLLVAHKYDLNPFTKEIYAFPDKRAGIIPIVGVDGFITIANRNQAYDGYDLSWADDEVSLPGAKTCPKWCEVKVFRKDRDHPIMVREYLDEVYQEIRNGYSGPWQTHTKRMLRHKTIIQGLRVAFGLSGIYDEDEAERIVEGEVIEEGSGLCIGKPDVEMPKEAPERDAPAFDQALSSQEDAKIQALEAAEDSKSQATKQGDLYISEAQAKRLLAIASSNGYTKEEVDAYVRAHEKMAGVFSVTKQRYPQIVSRFEVKKDA